MTRATVLAVALALLCTAPLAGQRAAPNKLLLLTHAALYKHPSRQPAEEAVRNWGAGAGFAVTTLQGYAQESGVLDLSFLTPAYLAQFDGLMLMTNGNLPLALDQKRAIVDFVRNGRVIIGVHALRLADAVRLPGFR